MRSTIPTLCLAATLGIAAAWLAPFDRASRAAGQNLLFISGMRIAGVKPVALVRITNISPNPGDIFVLHYTIRETSQGIPLSQEGAGVGAQLNPGESIVLDLGKIVSIYRAAHEVGPYSGPVQFVAFGDDGFTRPFGPESIHVECTQTEGKAIYDGVVQWSVQ